MIELEQFVEKDGHEPRMCEVNPNSIDCVMPVPESDEIGCAILFSGSDSPLYVIDDIDYVTAAIEAELSRPQEVVIVEDR